MLKKNQKNNNNKTKSVPGLSWIYFQWFFWLILMLHFENSSAEYLEPVQDTILAVEITEVRSCFLYFVSVISLVHKS